MLIVTRFYTPIGWFEVEYDEHYIHRAAFIETPADIGAVNSLTATVANELSCYFANSHHRFQLTLKPQGTTYQQRVWNALLVIPVGRSLSYGELAQTLQSSPRAIGQACKANPLALFIPCHRVVGKDNQGGYMGCPEALSYKLNLLAHESGHKIPLAMTAAP